MANLIVDLPVPAGDGAGAAVSVAGLSLQKTVTVRGAFTAQIEVQARGVASGGWNTVAVFSGPGKKPLPLAAAEMRVLVRAHSSGTANVDVGAAVGTLQSVAPAVPVGLGPGAASSIAGFPQALTIYCTGAFEGLVAVQVSLDGVGWTRCAQFQTGGGVKTISVVGTMVRVLRLESAGGAPAAVSVAATTGSGAGGGASAAGFALIYDPTASRPPAANVFTDFDELHAAANAIQGPKIVIFDSGGTGTVALPVGAYSFQEWIIRGTPFFFGTGVGTTITIAEGTTISYSGQLTVEENAILEFTGSTPVITPSAGDQIFVQNGAALRCTGTGPLISLSGLSGGEVFLAFVFRGGRLEDAGASQAVIDVPVAGAIFFMNVLDSGEWQAETISGIVGSIVSFSVSSSSSQISLNQPAFAGLQFAGDPQKARWFANPVAGVAKPVTDIVSGETHVYDTSGGAIVQALPSAANITPGESIIFKKVAGAATLTLSPDGADTIDGAGSFVITSVTGSIMLIRDALGTANWLVFGAGP